MAYKQYMIDSNSGNRVISDNKDGDSPPSPENTWYYDKDSTSFSKGSNDQEEPIVEGLYRPTFQRSWDPPRKDKPQLIEASYYYPIVFFARATFIDIHVSNHRDFLSLLKDDLYVTVFHALNSSSWEILPGYAPQYPTFKHTEEDTDDGEKRTRQETINTHAVAKANEDPRDLNFSILDTTTEDETMSSLWKIVFMVPEGDNKTHIKYKITASQSGVYMHKKTLYCAKTYVSNPVADFADRPSNVKDLSPEQVLTQTASGGLLSNSAQYLQNAKMGYIQIADVW